MTLHDSADVGHDSDCALISKLPVIVGASQTRRDIGTSLHEYDTPAGRIENLRFRGMNFGNDEQVRWVDAKRLVAAVDARRIAIEPIRPEARLLVKNCRVDSIGG